MRKFSGATGRKVGFAHQELVNAPRGFASFGNCLDDERLSAAAVACSEDVRNGSLIIFAGLDFARLVEFAGVIYQTLPDPANTNPVSANVEAYPGADIFPNSGRVRVSVGPEKVQVEYIASRLPVDATPEHPNGEVLFSYDVPAQ